MRVDSSITFDKAFKFAIRIVDLYKYLCENKKEYVLSKQILRCGTSIGANISEASKAQSKKDFVSKYYIAFKEAAETEYWIKLLIATTYIDEQTGNSLLLDISEILKLLHSSIKTAKQTLSN
ncbi:four helix bundle protein [Petroclostridium sp. X23]|jgi:four helix bundle protein|uniref:four helix bundle protein n=1 Tax=Petroclostridium sp. X23 TaxID=3045146 RepID=UPI0024ACBE3E|nr:four helix bundle protein [Petroclostridium sp. X23]WHH57519.1 four helix bundle protein [Petroclostridium sp. X23]